MNFPSQSSNAQRTPSESRSPDSSALWLRFEHGDARQFPHALKGASTTRAGKPGSAAAEFAQLMEVAASTAAQIEVLRHRENAIRAWLKELWPKLSEADRADWTRRAEA